MVIHFSILAWKIPWIEELGGLQAQGVAKSHTWLHFHFHFIFTRISKQAKLFWKQKKISDCTLDWAMTVMKHAVSVTQSVCVCENFVKKTFKICASVSVLCINRKKKAMRKILNSGYICILIYMFLIICLFLRLMIWQTISRALKSHILWLSDAVVLRKFFQRKQ